MNLYGNNRFSVRRCTKSSIAGFVPYARVRRTTMGRNNSELLCDVVSGLLVLLGFLNVPCTNPVCSKLEVTLCLVQLKLSDWMEILLKALSSLFTCPFLCQSRQGFETKHLLNCMLLGQLASQKHFMKP